MSDESTVSVVIPAHNAERFLPSTLSSVLAQTLREIEVIVVDDGSTDGTRAAAEAFAGDGRVRCISQPQAGVSAARNRGVAETRSRFVAFLDADDVWLEHKLERSLRCLENSRDSALAHSDLEVIDENGVVTGEIMRGREGRVLEPLLLWDGVTVPGAMSNIVIRREVIESVGGLDAELSTAADQDLMFRVAAGNPIARVPSVLVQYRVHGSNMHRNVAVMELDHLRAYRKAAQSGLFRSRGFRRRCYSNLYLILAGSWWKHGNDRLRALKMLAFSLTLYPPNAAALLRRRMARFVAGPA